MVVRPSIYEHANRQINDATWVGGQAARLTDGHFGSRPMSSPVHLQSTVLTYVVHIHFPTYPTCYLTYSARPISPYYPNPGTISRESQIGPPGDMGTYAS